MNNDHRQNNQPEYRLDPKVAASLRVPARTDLTQVEIALLKQLDADLEAMPLH